MRLWEAIVKGAEKHPQCFGVQFEGVKREDALDGGYSGVKSCAQGAALIGLGGKAFSGFDAQANQLRPFSSYLFKPNITSCWVCGEKPLRPSSGIETSWTLWTLLAHMNDCHHLSRPAIAFLVYFHERSVLGGSTEDDKKFKRTFHEAELSDWHKVQARTVVEAAK
jgi:hypothetical protein